MSTLTAVRPTAFTLAMLSCGIITVWCSAAHAGQIERNRSFSRDYSLASRGSTVDRELSPHLDRDSNVAVSPPPPVESVQPRVYAPPCPNGYRSRNYDGTCPDNCCR